MKVLSLFDGISCGRIALERAGINIDKYVAYEINKSSIIISKHNYPSINHKGDVSYADFKEYIGFDLLIGGSPCQSLSSSNVWLKDGEYGVNGTGPSRLFWEYVRAFLTIKPRFFLFENVASMKKQDRNIITTQLGVYPIMINSIQFSAQNRRRLYWTNIPFLLMDCRYVDDELNDCLENNVEDRYYLKEGTLKCILTPSDKWVSGKMEINPKYARPITASCWKIHRADTDNYVSTIYKPDTRTNVRMLTPLECERLQTLPDNYTNIDGVTRKDRYEAIGNGWTIDVIAHIFKSLK